MSINKIIRNVMAYAGGLALCFGAMGWQRAYYFTTNLCIWMLWLYVYQLDEELKNKI